MRPAIFLLVALVTLFVLVEAAERPKIPEEFTAGTDSVVRSKKEVVTAKGILAVDHATGRSYDFQKVDVPHRHELDFERVDRYDLKRSYEVVDNKTCRVHIVDGTQPEIWAWVTEASYDGTQVIEGTTYDIWALKRGYAHIFLAVVPNFPNVPVFLMTEHPERNVSTRFNSWQVGTPNAAYFNVPSECTHNNMEEIRRPLLGCVGRSTMISRAQVWVDNHVPYSQSGSYGGYRTDCSGYVSMAWEAAKPGYTTFTMHEIAHPITRGELQPGDVLLCASEHVVIFGGWSGSTHYVAFEETRPGEGTVKRVTPYPYW